MARKNYDAVIVGGGVNGSAIAYNLAKRGLKPLIVEKTDICAEASNANGGGVRQSARDDRELPLAMLSVKLFETLSEELGHDVEYRQAGNLRLCTTEDQLAAMAAMVEKQRGMGLELEMLDQKQVRELCPYVADKVIGASHCPTDGHANPMATTFAFAKKARELGAELALGEEVVDITLSGGAVTGVVTNKGRYNAPVVVNVAGVKGREVARMVGLDFPMRPVFTEVLITEASRPLFPQMFGTASSDFYGHQCKHGSFVWGGFAGYESFLHEGLDKPNYSQIGPAICRAVLNFFPVLKDLHVIRVWSGLIAQVSDKAPVLGRVEEAPGYVSATGFSGHGFGICAAVGKLIGEVVADGRPSLSLEAFRYDRFLPKN